MIVLTKEQRDQFLTAKTKYQVKLSSEHTDYVPIEIKGDLWILPEEVLQDKRFSDLKTELFDTGKLGIIRDVDNAELIITDIK